MGRIIISERAIKKIAAFATIECYGVVGLAPKTIYDRILRVLKLEEYESGVDVEIINNETLVISLFVILQSGINILEVANTIVSQVSYVVKNLTGIKNIDVNVTIRGIKGER
ncbi:MAG: Asp23/Gls24 family envelope stress response protein [Caldisericaceae bacterium]